METVKVKVAIRVRPLSKRELEIRTENVVVVDSNQITVNNPTNLKEGRKSAKQFAFDYCFDSSSTNAKNYSSQEDVYNCLGIDIINNALGGYNACIFAYGQTGSGKSYTMTGGSDNKGLIPRICEGIFQKINELSSSSNENQFKVEVSYMEIYNEKVQDLLDPSGQKHNLKVREHKLLGIYVDGLSQLAVTSYKDIEALINEGNKSRTVAATNMNSESSRSHAVFCLKISQTITDSQSGISGEKVSKLSLVDLAGSEKASKTGVEGDRLKEGCNINRSLHTLGLVISALAENTKTNKVKHIPYRDSVLTWLLKDSLGGNSKTVMIATVSPAFDNYEETVNTLRYADRAKRIENHAVVNEDPNAKVIRELREEIEKLKSELKIAKEKNVNETKNEELIEKLDESERLYKEISKPWDEKLAESEKIQQEFNTTLQKLGISVEFSGIKVEKDKFYLVNVNADESMNELLVYYLKELTVVGRNEQADIKLFGPGIADEHCKFEIIDNKVYLTPLNDQANTRVNGRLITSQVELHNGNRIVLGVNHYFRIKCPNKNKNLHEQQQQQQQNQENYDEHDEFNENNNYENGDGDDDDENHIDYYTLQEEVFKQKINSNAFDMQSIDKRRIGNVVNDEKYLNKRKLLIKLNEQLINANKLVNEANSISREMKRNTFFSVTLQIPVERIKLNSNHDMLPFEPAILVRRDSKYKPQVWSIEKFENRMIEIREMYAEVSMRNDRKQILYELKDPFYEALEDHRLIGVANVYLEPLFYDCTFDYAVPIINEHGEVKGRLRIQLKRNKEYFFDNDDPLSSNNSTRTDTDTNSDTNSEDMERSNNKQVKKHKFTFIIKEAIGIPPSLSNLVFCIYKFWNEKEESVFFDENCGSFIDYDQIGFNSYGKGVVIKFNHTKEYTVKMNDEFADYFTDNSLSIQVWGRQPTVSGVNDKENDKVNDKINEIELSRYSYLINAWQQVRKSFEIWIDILELDKTGQWICVEVKQHEKNLTGGIYQLKQGQSRRIRVRVRQKQGTECNYDLLPIYIESINEIEVGSVLARSTSQPQLDSYQEEDLKCLRENWTKFLDRRKAYLDAQVKSTMNNEERTDFDLEREVSLYEQMVSLTEERNAVDAPPENSGLPGSTLNWKRDFGLEENIPIVYLGNESSDDVNNDDGSESVNNELDDDGERGGRIAGERGFLPYEDPDESIFLEIIGKQTVNENELHSIATWDSSRHESLSLNQVTTSDRFIYLIVKVKLQLKYPKKQEIVVRKRICVQIYADSIKQNFSRITKLIPNLSTLNPLGGSNMKSNEKRQTYSTGIVYYVIDRIPKCLEEFEQRESLAIMAAAFNDNVSVAVPGETDEIHTTYIDLYMKSIETFFHLLKNDKIKQELALKQAIDFENQPNVTPNQSMSRTSSTTSLKKSTSVSNLHHSPMKKFNSTQNLSQVNGGDNSPSKLKPQIKQPTQPSNTTLSPMNPQPVKIMSPATGGANAAHSRFRSPIPINSNLLSNYNKYTSPEQIQQSTPNASSQVSPTSFDVSSLLTPTAVESKIKPTNKPESQAIAIEKEINDRKSVPESRPKLESTSSTTSTSTLTPGTIKEPAITTKTNENQAETNVKANDIKPTITQPEVIVVDENKGNVKLINKTTDEYDGKQSIEKRNERSLSNEDLSHNSSKNESSKSPLNVPTMTPAYSSTSIASRDVEEPLPEWLKENLHVVVSTSTVQNKPGIVRFIGPTKFAKGTWIGVELERPFGLNDGSYKERRYFQCEKNHGVFVRADKLTLNKMYYPDS